MNSDKTTLWVDRHTHDVLAKVAKIKRWSLITLLQFFAELFVVGLDMLDDPDVDIKTLRELYSNWSLGLMPYGRDQNE